MFDYWSRKYRLLLTLSHQYLAQVPEEIKGTVFGNIGSIIAMRVEEFEAPIVWPHNNVLWNLYFQTSE